MGFNMSLLSNWLFFYIGKRRDVEREGGCGEGSVDRGEMQVDGLGLWVICCFWVVACIELSRYDLNYSPAFALHPLVLMCLCAPFYFRKCVPAIMLLCQSFPKIQHFPYHSQTTLSPSLFFHPHSKPLYFGQHLTPSFKYPSFVQVSPSNRPPS